MAEKIATRAAYGEALAALGEHYPQLVVLDADLSGSTMSKKFADKYPERFFNMGIAEANMTTGVLQAIPDDLYEAATMDGASAFTRLRTITLPLVLYAIAPIIITQYTFNFNNFNIIYLFNNGGPAVAGSNAGGTDILVSWIYKLTMSSSQYAIAATITILLSIFVVGLALWQFRATKSFKNDDMA